MHNFADHAGLDAGDNYTSHISMSAVPEQPCDGRVSRKLRSNNTLPMMLPTISEDEEVDFEMLYSSSPTSSCTSSSCSVDNRQPASYETCSAQLSLSLEQQQQQLEAELNAEEMLLAAIDMRLLQLLELRDQRQAAAAFRARSVAPLPVATAPQPLWYGPYPPPAPVPTAADASSWHAAGYAAACRPAQHAMQQPCAEQILRQAPAHGLNTAGRMAVLKLQQLQAAQRMHCALENDLMEMLANSF